MADGKITLYGELKAGFNGPLLDISLVKNAFAGTRKTIEDINEASGIITIKNNKFYRIYQTSAISFYLERASDTRLHSLEFLLITGEETHTVDFPEDIKWVKELELLPNCCYSIIIENDIAMWAVVELN
jgi:hypothetical protein